MLKPIDRLLRLIEFRDVWAEITLPTFSDAGEYAYVLRMIFSAIEEFFTIDFNHKLNTQLIGNVLSDAIMNAAEHGNKGDCNKQITLVYWLGQNGVLFGIRDQGDFFHKQSTKQLIESRKKILSTRADPGGFGMANIYQADEIYVSPKENTLYLAILANSMIY